MTIVADIVYKIRCLKPHDDLVVILHGVCDQFLEGGSRIHVTDLTQNVLYRAYNCGRFGLLNASIFVESITEAIACVGLTRRLHPKAKTPVMPTMECALGMIERDK